MKEGRGFAFLLKMKKIAPWKNSVCRLFLLYGYVIYFVRQLFVAK